MEGKRRKISFFFAGKILIFPALLFLFSGCSNSLQKIALEEVDYQVGEIFNKFKDDQKNKEFDFSGNGKSEEVSAGAASSLTESQREKIDSWLEDNGYNRYGDAKNAIYKGGTPLFDEETGEVIDRYSYILKKFPDILNKISGE